MPILQILKHWNVIPLWPGQKLRVRRIGLWPQFCGPEIRQKSESNNDENRESHVHHELFGIKRLRRAFGTDWIFSDRSRGASFSEGIDMHRDKSKNECGNQEHMQYEESRQGERAHLGSATKQFLERISHPWNFTQDVGSYGGCEIGFLVPGQ